MDISSLPCLTRKSTPALPSVMRVHTSPKPLSSCKTGVDVLAQMAKEHECQHNLANAHGQHKRLKADVRRHQTCANHRSQNCSKSPQQSVQHCNGVLSAAFILFLDGL